MNIKKIDQKYCNRGPTLAEPPAIQEIPDIWS